MKNSLKYYRCEWKNIDVKGDNKGLYVYFFEVNTYDKSDIRRVVYYPDSTIRAADFAGGYMGEQITPSSMYEENLIEEFNKTPNSEAKEITKPDFEREWNKAISQPGFYLKPYSEYTQEDYNKR